MEHHAPRSETQEGCIDLDPSLLPGILEAPICCGVPRSPSWHGQGGHGLQHLSTTLTVPLP
jgi:hypothetical protein